MLSTQKEELQPLVDEIRVQAKYDEIKVVMESTGVYHLSIAYFLQQNGLFVSVVNALKVANFNKAENFRHTKTDSIDSTNIARYGIAYWAKLPQFDLNGDKYFLLKRLCDAYLNFSEERSRILLQLQSQLEQTMPGIFDLFGGFDINSGKDKLLDFLERYCHIEDIIAKSEAEFVASYREWAKKKKDTVPMRVKQRRSTLKQRMVSLPSPIIQLLEKPSCGMSDY